MAQKRPSLFSPFRRPHVEKEMKVIHYAKNPDGTVDTTPRVLLVWPIFDNMKPQACGAFFAMCLQAARYCPEIKFDVMTPERTLIHMAMNHAADACVKNPWYQGMICFDDDCLPPAGLVQKMMLHWNRGHHIVAAMGYMRGYPHTTTVGRFLEAGPTIFKDAQSEDVQRGFEWIDTPELLKADEHGLIDVDFCGMPAMWISRKVLVDLEAPHFLHEDGTGAQTTHDIHFCNKARDKGYQIKVDISLECAHIGAGPLITRETRDQARLAVQIAEEQRKLKANGTHD